MRRAPKLPICEHYEIYNGNPVAVLFRIEGASKTLPCPFCAKSHKHASGPAYDGHRNDHCGSNITYKSVRGYLYEVKLTPDEITASDGTIIKREHGYIIRTINRKP